MSDYTLKKLTDTENVAPKFGMDEFGEVRFPSDEYDARDTGFSFHRLKPNARQPFGHRHENAEEVYVVVAGSGRVKLEDEILDLEPLHGLRVAPGVTRCFEAGGEGLDLLAFGPRHRGDGEILPGWWSD